MQDPVNTNRSTPETRVLQLQTKITDSWFDWKRTGEQRHYDATVRTAKQLDRIYRRQFASGTTIPIGIFHSSGTGFATLPVDSLEQVVKEHPGADIFGFIRMSHETAEYSAASYEHNHEMKEKAKKRQVDFQHSALSDLLLHAFVPTPKPFSIRTIVGGISRTEELPVLGPIPLNDEAAAQFVNWVRGPLLHNQLADDYASGRPNQLLKELHHLQLFAVSQMTGIWQAHPYTPKRMRRPSDLEAHAKNYYSKRPKESIAEIARLTGTEIPESDLEKAARLMDGITSAMIFKADPENGNVGRYFDSALRNFISDVGDINGTSQDVLRAVFKGGHFNFYEFWNVFARIDFSNADRLWAAYEEDASHITENMNVVATHEQKMQYVAAMTLTRRALQLYKDFESGEKQTIRRANEAAEQLQDLREGRIAPTDAPDFRKYLSEFEPTIRIMPSIRKLRQAELALIYMAKAVAHQDMADAHENDNAIADRVSEASAYMSSVVREIPEIADAAGIRLKSPVFSEGSPVLHDLLGNALDRISKGRYSSEEMRTTGGYYLETLR